jgi:hypothetical protein
VEAQQCVELTGTNRSRAYPEKAGHRWKSAIGRFASGFEGASLKSATSA